MHLQGIAADGVAAVEALDRSGNVIATTPVVDNRFASKTELPLGAAAAIHTRREWTRDGDTAAAGGAAVHERLTTPDSRT
jgi:hypothetical protein